MISLDAICVTSTYQERKKIFFDEGTGLIDRVVNPKDDQKKSDYYFSDDCLLFAGMGDVHIHAREDASQKNTYKEDFITARAALHNGGCTHAGDMPNNPIPPVDDESYQKKFELSVTKTNGEIWTYAGIGPETRPLKLKVPYKVYMGPSVGELYFKDLEGLDHALSHYKEQWVSFHCEDPVSLKKHEFEKSHEKKRPIEAEVIATQDALKLIKKYKLRGKLCHFSSFEGFKLVQKAKAEGVSVSLEVTPQHLYFDVNSVPGDELVSLQMNPPLRDKLDREALFQALKNGELDYLATDHAPHTTEEKKKGTSGVTGLDTFGPFVTWLIFRGIDPRIISKVASENPGVFFNEFLFSWRKLSNTFEGFGKGLGFLLPGFRANFTVLNLKRPLTIQKEHLKTKVQHSPFEGVTFPGQVEALFIGGKRV